METVILLLSVVASAALIGLAWYAARRDLTGASIRAHNPESDELRALHGSLEALIAEMDRKAAEIERRMQVYFARLEALEAVSPTHMAESVEEPNESVAGGEAAAEQAEAPVLAAPTSRIDSALSLLDGGGDVSAAARAMGLTVAEVETAIRIRQMRSGRT